MNLCIAGTAGHLYIVMEALPRGDWNVTGICPSWPEENVEGQANRLRVKGYDTKAFTDYNIMLDSCKPDAVVVCGHNGSHGPMSVEAAKRGIHNLCEKPLCTTFGEYAELTAALNDTGAKIMAMHTFRYNGVFAAAREAVKRGDIGTLRMMDARKSYKMGSRPWHYAKREAYGGTLSWVGIHAIDWFVWFSGEAFTSVYANQSNGHNNGNGEMETTGFAAFTMTGDVCATMTCDYYRPSAAPTHGDDRIRLVGTDGVLEIMDNQAVLLNANGSKTLEPLIVTDIFTDFTRLIKDGVAALSQEDSLKATYAALKATESADKGVPVQF
jgi:predicted dehydrogenase